MSAQEAVADRLHCCTVSCNPLRCHPSWGSQAQILQATRLLSILHGTPEAIPVINELPYFARPHDPPHAHVDWSCDVFAGQHRLTAVINGIEQAARGLSHMGCGFLHLLEANQVDAVLEAVTMVNIEGEPEGPCAEIELLLREAAQNGEAVLMGDCRNNYYPEDYETYEE